MVAVRKVSSNVRWLVPDCVYRLLFVLSSVSVSVSIIYSYTIWMFIYFFSAGCFICLCVGVCPYGRLSLRVGVCVCCRERMRLLFALNNVLISFSVNVVMFFAEENSKYTNCTPLGRIKFNSSVAEHTENSHTLTHAQNGTLTGRRQLECVNTHTIYTPNAYARCGAREQTNGQREKWKFLSENENVKLKEKDTAQHEWDILEWLNERVAQWKWDSDSNERLNRDSTGQKSNGSELWTP